MIKLRNFFLFMVSVLSFSSCEKDDICVDADTALLIIRFYDAANPTEFKPVESLRVVGVGNTFTVNTIADRTSTLDSIAIPLKTNTLLTAFNFITNSEDDDNGAEIGNSDQIAFNYEVNESFKSRACGFVAIYNNLNTDFTATPEDWIQTIEIVKPTVQTEETVTAHVKIFH